MVIWAAFILAGFLCAPLLRWPGFVITTILVTVLYWSMVGVPGATLVSYAVNFILVMLAMQFGYVLGLLASAGAMRFWRNGTAPAWLRPRGVAKKDAGEAGTIKTQVERSSTPSRHAE